MPFVDVEAMWTGAELLRKGTRAQVESASSALARPVRLGNCILTKVLGRYPFYLDPDDESLSPHLAVSGYWESWVAMSMAKLVWPGMRCLDIGANVGYFSVLLAALSGEPVTAVEPNPRAASLVRKNARVNGVRIEVVEAMASDSEGVGRLSCGNIDLGGGTLHEKLLPRDGSIGTIESREVRIVRLGATLTGRFDFIKIDAEGMDYKALAGCAEIMHPGTIILLEHCVGAFGSVYEPDGDSCLRAAAAGKSLRHTGYDGFAEEIDIEAVLAQPHRIWNLVLSQGS